MSNSNEPLLPEEKETCVGTCFACVPECERRERYKQLEDRNAPHKSRKLVWDAQEESTQPGDRVL